MTEFRLLFGHFYISAFLQHLRPALRRLFGNCKQKVAVFDLSEYYSSANSSHNTSELPFFLGLPDKINTFLFIHTALLPDKIHEYRLSPFGKFNAEFIRRFLTTEEIRHIFAENAHRVHTFGIFFHLFRARAVNEIPVP